MPTYLVRNRDTERAVGIFAVSDINELVKLVRRLDDVNRCEYSPYSRVPKGGFVFTAFDTVTARGSV